MSDSLMAEVVIPFAGQRFDMELALFADVEVLIVECLRWVSEQIGLLPATGTHFFCNSRTREIICYGTRLCDTGIIRGDRLIIF